ncbi:MAG: shikimate kinase [Myxococcaceae bacterium]
MDPRLRQALREELERPGPRREVALPSGRRLVLCGHRAAGKSRLLPLVAELTGRPSFDLDAEVARRAGRELRAWFAADPEAFRAGERRAFEALPAGAVVAVGGGFLAHHADLLRGHLAVLVPVTFETYRERLLADDSRPRLRPELAPEDEIAAIYREREALHALHPALPLVELLRAALAGGS